MASKAGQKVALIEKNDFASGTSSKSTKLVHGGIRYLENLEFDLVFEALHERAIQLKAAPHLVKPLAFIIPVYKGDKRPLWMMKLGVWLYDVLAGRYRVDKHESLTAAQLFKTAPSLKQEGLKGGVLYYDAQMDDARVCLENVLSAAQHGADVANYVEVRSFLKQNGKAIGIAAQDNISREIFEILAKKIVCAVGPWTNTFLKLDNRHAKKMVRTTKGIHLVYKGKITDQAMLIPSQRDNRIFFIIPFMGNTLIGTTDTDYIGSPDKVHSNDNDVQYLTEETKRVFPNFNFRDTDIITTFAGLRPLIRSGGVAPSKATRKHVISKTNSGITFVIGGKFTTYRQIAQDCLKHLKIEPAKESFSLYGSGAITEKSEDIAKKYNLDIETVKSLLDKYGNRYSDVLKLIDKNPFLSGKICDCSPFIKAQIVYSTETEMAVTPADIIERRLSLQYIPCKNQNCRDIIAGYFKK